MIKVIFSVEGMSCRHCEKAVKDAIAALNGIMDCQADAKSGEVGVCFDETQVNVEALKDKIVETGYMVL